MHLEESATTYLLHICFWDGFLDGVSDRYFFNTFTHQALHIAYNTQVISQLSLDLDDLAKRLREAGRTRENKLKQAKAPEGRVTMPFLLKSMDEVRAHITNHCHSSCC